MITLRSYIGGRWVEGSGQRATLVNPSTEEPVAEAGTGGIDFRAAIDHARTVGVPGLRELTFRQRGDLLRALSRLIHAHRDELIAPAMQNGGNTRGDAKFDIDGASGTLAHYAEVGATIGDARVLTDGEGVQLGRSARFHGQHILTPRDGVAVHINAFNFPAWGLAEKLACALLAGVPVITKPATSTALTAYRIALLIIEAKILPEGALTFLAGATGDLLNHLTGQDVLAFTGSSDTGAWLRALPHLIGRSVHVNIEADSLNAAVLTLDAERGTPAYDLFITEVAREITQKAGQKCTAVRRIIVPAPFADAVQEDLAERLAAVKVGDPAHESATMGPLATAQQLRDVRAGIARLRAEADTVFGGDGAVTPLVLEGAAAGKGYFVGPVLLRCNKPDLASAVHSHEVFGPVATILPYDGESRSAAQLVRRGGGTLVVSIYGDDRERLTDLALAIAPYTGRIHLGSSKLAGQATPPGTVLPQMIHGGPGRAGGGEELGGLRGLAFYMQRTAIQGDKPIVEQLARPKG
ncbi:MAG: 3,4-dehydroadipyl-CoA semialdehyde dehydrogenase [Myxococcales bacterium]|nr:3,4-dehydroadipyl-CoA semialdehyde dehydrogenase [Myxococcales bacterium]